MPKLQEYVSPSRELKPDNQGYQAWETAGRRVGGLYREAAGDTARTAKIKAQMLADEAQWPFTLFALKQKFAPPKATTAETAAPGGGFRVAGGSSGMDLSRRSMPNLAAANYASQREEAYALYNPLSKSLSPEGAHNTTLADEARRLTNQLVGLVGGGGTFSTMPGTSPNADAYASADAWGRSVAGVPVSTGVGSYTDPGYGWDYGGGSSSTASAYPGTTNQGITSSPAGPGTMEILAERE